ncbi:MAG: DUF6600 domain-containing protein [Bacteroidota bacterium]
MKRLLMLFGILAFLPLIDSQETSLSAHGKSIAMGVRFGHAGYFYSSLRPYGEWIELESGFYGWRPVRVRSGWRPYMNGRWAWTDHGWYWMSHEPFGWAVFHYGRWYHDEYYGWIWIPDDVWGPAWVEWRSNDDYIGWAPLPPYASFSISIGIRFTTRWYAPSNYWCFVRYGHFTSTRIDGYVVNEGETRRLIRTTRGAVRYEVDRDRIINRGIDRETIERRGNTRIVRTEVTETRNREERMVQDGTRERIEVFRPSRTDLERSEGRIEARQLERRSTLNLDRIERNRSNDQIQRSGFEQRRPPDESRGTEERRTVQPREQSRRESPADNRTRQERSSTPERSERSGEFRRVQPERPSIERKNESQPERRQPTIKSEPRRESSPQQRQGSRSGGNKRGRDQ